MSKIQKALKALKGSSDNTGEEKDRPSRRRNTFASASMGGVSSPETLVPEAGHANKIESGSESNKPSGMIPGAKVHIDIEQVIDAGLAPNLEDEHVISQQFRRIKRPILQTAFESDLPLERNSNVIMMASALPGAGKSFCAYNLATSISLERDLGAVLVDADVLKPGLSMSLGLSENLGLVDYLLDETVSLSDIVVRTNLNDIYVIPAGRQHAHTTELLASRRMKRFVESLADEFPNRGVVFDTPPLLLTNEAQVLAQVVGQIVFVIESRVSSQESAQIALSMLDRRKPINAILNKSRNAEGSGYKGESYGYYPYQNWKNSYEKD